MPPPVPRTARDILVELLDTRLLLGGAYVGMGQFAQLRDLLESAAKDAAALITIDDGAAQKRLDAYLPKSRRKKKVRRKTRATRNTTSAPRSNADELRERPCPRPNCTWKRVTTAQGLAVHIGRAHKGETF